ncbi:Probable glycogen synthase 2,glycogen synthase,Glycogen synthase,glycogen/starch synthase, ADP-glucose type,Starch synthase catalytic domain [Chlamydia serpentis]|uniref:Glycogen synthase n=1 Tax=Chlamydia serpentis TaxID=1967782 RepID=A0A2R8FCL4_9CHLA|nr:glycogen synthase GlgA [Chlamydia serpentis]SPN74056.1 Probable glycogen synthase 2,glycogen synthase,Glycogen synthase,glycogen/starch synthase, ADP-glucose type,Starch synthase catalytic domain [Chlamydia serpentis]
MRIVQVAVEFTPIIKVGGLGDAVASLSKELAKQHDVEILIPYYPLIFKSSLSHVLSERSFYYEFLGKQQASAISYSYEGLTLTIIKLDSQIDFFSTTLVYCDNSVVSFSAFAAAAAAYLQETEPPDIVHLHDWHVGLLAGLLKHPLSRVHAKLVFTIHNFGYRGYCSTQMLAASQIDDFHLSHYQLFRDPQTSVIMKGALYCSDYVTTVSLTYVQEIINDYSDYELHDAILAKNSVFSGIINGIDEDVWNPETDPALAVNYDASLLSQPEVLFTKKEENKAALYTKLGMSLDYSPLVCVISRVVEEKGPEFMKEIILHAMENSYAFILIGTSQNDYLLNQFRNLQECLANSPNIRLILDFNDSLARLTYAASDMICVPSHREACGLTQLIAMRYGTVPLVRKTGGLADTVIPGVNGFTFSDTNNFKEFRDMLSNALTTYLEQPDIWFNLIEAGMLRESGLDTMAANYQNLYQSLLS